MLPAKSQVSVTPVPLAASGCDGSARPLRRNRSIPIPAGPIPLRLYHPVDGGAPPPVLVYYHGGGWVIGDLETHDVLCCELALGAGCAVVAVDYRSGG